MDAMAASREAFLDRFGPQALRSLTAKDCLDVLALSQQPEVGMDHWMELRYDDIFDGALFGAIRGGSVLKFVTIRALLRQWLLKD